MRQILLTAFAFAGWLVLSGALGTLPAVAASGTGDETLPPDPGEAGKATLEGIDFDGDGLRDDVQRYITFTFPNSARVRAAATQYAQRIQESLFVGEDRVRAVNLAAEIDQSARCFAAMHGSNNFETLQSSHSAENALRTIILNTVERGRTYLAFDSLLAGGIFSGTPKSTWASQCDFDPSSDRIGG